MIRRLSTTLKQTKPKVELDVWGHNLYTLENLETISKEPHNVLSNVLDFPVHHNDIRETTVANQKV